MQAQSTPTPPPPPATVSDGRVRDRRPALERVIFADRRGRGWVQVVLQWPHGEQTEGSSLSGASREARARAAATAVQKALESNLTALNAQLDVDEILLQKVGNKESVLIAARLYQSGRETNLSGSAFIEDDVVTAAARATLSAVNRKIALAMAASYT